MRLDDFALDLACSQTPSGHLFVGSGMTTVQPLERTAAGVGGFYSPPYAAHGVKLAVTFLVDDMLLITDTGSWGKGDVGLLYQGGTWRPDRIERRGTYNHLAGGVHRSLGVRTELVPFAAAAGYVLRVEVTNRGPAPTTVQVHARLEPGMVELRPLSTWVFGLPRAGAELVEAAPGRYRGHGMEIRVSAGGVLALGPGATGTVDITVSAGTVAAGGAPVVDGPAAEAGRTRAAWERRIERYTARLPEVESTIPGLVDFWRRSVASGLVCIWENPAFVTSPFLATSGMDGGAIVTYLWDTGGYVPAASTLLLGSDVIPVIDSLARIPLETFFAVAPDGTPTGTPYSYSVFSFLSLAWNVFCLLGPERRLYDEARRLFDLAEERTPRRGELLDYGEQRNMLEMRGTGWEHVVASPNAERAWCLDRLADLGEHLGAITAAEAAANREKARRIRAAIKADLWDAKARWFRSIFPDGHVEIAHSIQAFDAMRAGACDTEMEGALLEKVVDGAFLGDYGVSSVSRTDPVHYEWNDPDWSGAGAYTGDPPVLALTLWERGHAALAWEVYRRLFWMGKHLPYYPQEHRCDVPQTLAHKRANCISGLGGVEALVFGMAGVAAGLDGTITVTPRPAPAGEVALRGLVIRGTRIDVTMAPGRIRVSCNGKRVYEGAPTTVTLPR